MVLLRLQLAPLAFVRRAFFEDLNLHAEIGGVAFERRADAEAVVGTFFKFEFKAQDEVFIFLFGEQIAAAAFGAIGTPLVTP